MNKPAISVLSKLVNSLYSWEVSNETVLFVLENTANIDDKDEFQTLRYVFTCAASIAQLAQRYHSKDSLRAFFEELGNIVSRVDDYLSILDEATNNQKFNMLESLKSLPRIYGQVIIEDAGKSTIDSACVDMTIQSAINGMLMVVMEKID